MNTNIDRQNMIDFLNSTDDIDIDNDISTKILWNQQNECFIDVLINIFNSVDPSEPSCTDITTIGQLYDVSTLFHQTVHTIKTELMTVAEHLSLTSMMDRYIDIEEVADDLHRWIVRFFNNVEINISTSDATQEHIYRYSIDIKLMTLAAFADFYEYLSEQSVQYEETETETETEDNQTEETYLTVEEQNVMNILSYQRNN